MELTEDQIMIRDLEKLLEASIACKRRVIEQANKQELMRTATIKQQAEVITRLQKESTGELERYRKTKFEMQDFIAAQERDISKLKAQNQELRDRLVSQENLFAEVSRLTSKLHDANKVIESSKVLASVFGARYLSDVPDEIIASEMLRRAQERKGVKS